MVIPCPVGRDCYGLVGQEPVVRAGGLQHQLKQRFTVVGNTHRHRVSQRLDSFEGDVLGVGHVGLERRHDPVDRGRRRRPRLLPSSRHDPHSVRPAPARLAGLIGKSWMNAWSQHLGGSIDEMSTAGPRRPPVPDRPREIPPPRTRTDNGLLRGDRCPLMPGNYWITNTGNPVNQETDITPTHHNDSYARQHTGCMVYRWTTSSCIAGNVARPNRGQRSTAFNTRQRRAGRARHASSPTSEPDMPPRTATAFRTPRFSARSTTSLRGNTRPC